MGDTLRYVQVLIGDQMKVQYPDVFECLDGLRAFNITMERDKQRLLSEEDIIDEMFQDGDRIFFELDSAQFWLRVRFLLYQRTSRSLSASKETTDPLLEENEKLCVKGFTRIRVRKSETIQYLRKQLQLLIFQVWFLLLSEETKYYILDHFAVASLFPPAHQQQTQASPHDSHNNGSNSNATSDGPPAGQFRIQNVQSNSPDSSNRFVYSGTQNSSGRSNNKLLGSSPPQRDSASQAQHKKGNNKFQVVQEKQLTFNTDAMLCEQLFDYKN